MIIGTAGHIDHGKTALVKALTGVDGDRLREEKARGITIELGFAYTPSEHGTLGFIDVPGHERLVHTMLAGASGIDFVLLVVAADDGPKPQTLEHLAIIDLLGIDRGLVALTKADLVPAERLAKVEDEVRSALAGGRLAKAELMPVSAKTGLNIDALRQRLVAAAGLLRRNADGRRFRLAVDRSFTLAGIGTIVTGTILSGKVSVGDAVTISPSGLAARVRSLHVQNAPAAQGNAGDRCALNLAGPAISSEAIRRGDVVLDPALHAPTDRIDASLRILPGEPKPIANWFSVRLHHASVEVGARIVPLGEGPIAPGSTDDAQLVLDAPIAAATGDRYVVRDVSAQRTIGGGVFIDLRAPARKRRTPERAMLRKALAIGEDLPALSALLDAPPFFVDLTAFARDRALAADRVTVLADGIRPIIFDTGESRIALSADRWQAYASAIACVTAQFHGDNPDLQGIGREKLRLSLQPRLPAAAFILALQKLARDGAIVLDGSFIRLPTHELKLTAAEEAQWSEIAPLLGGEERFRPPRVRDLAGMVNRAEPEIRRLLKRAGRVGRLDEIAHDHFFLRGTVREMVRIIVDIDQSTGHAPFTAAQFRDRVQNGRKVAIQILEFFDRLGLTMRRGDLRRPNPYRLDLFGPVDAGPDAMPHSGSDLAGN